MRLETERLVLRELTNDDLAAWYAILSDAETMKHYPAPFDEDKLVLVEDAEYKEFQAIDVEPVDDKFVIITATVK